MLGKIMLGVLVAPVACLCAAFAWNGTDHIVYTCKAEKELATDGHLHLTRNAPTFHLNATYRLQHYARQHGQISRRRPRALREHGMHGFVDVAGGAGGVKWELQLEREYGQSYSSPRPFILEQSVRGMSKAALHGKCTSRITSGWRLIR